MSPEAQQIAIAEACGWSNFETRPEYPGRIWGMLDGVCRQLPDYLGDLNVMAEAEKYLTPMESVEYRTHWLWHVCYHGRPIEKIPLAAPIDASAAQRAEAFLRAKGLWTD